MNSNHRIPSRDRRGFTLVELLVVMGIIILLMAILLPTVGRVRIQAQTARSWANMSAIAGAIERYHGDEMAYPGLFSNQQLGANVNVTFNTTAGSVPPGTLTGTENMVLSLVGGPDYTTSTSAITVNLDDSGPIGKGPLTFSAAITKRVRKAAYIDAGGGLFPSRPYAGSGVAADHEVIGAAPTGTRDSAFPEFYDAYGTPRPIIYLRANITSSPTARMVATAPNGIGSNGELARYTIREFDFYKRGQAPNQDDFPGDFRFDGGTYGDYEMHPFVESYLGNPATMPQPLNAGTAGTAAPRGQNKYILISAGADRCYGTRDDLFFGGN